MCDTLAYQEMHPTPIPTICIGFTAWFECTAGDTLHMPVVYLQAQSMVLLSTQLLYWCHGHMA